MPKKTPEEEAKEWNASHPIGTKVRRFKLMHPRREPAGDTETIEQAWVMSGHSPVVRLMGVSGAVHLHALEVLKGQA